MTLVELSAITPVLACGPYFSDLSLGMTLAALLFFKPLTYFAFIQAFRYRVSRDVPMRFSKAAKLAALRTVIGLGMAALAGLLLVGGGGLKGTVMAWPVAWGVLIAERATAWYLIGKLGAGIRGRRLVGWTISGVMIDGAYDGIAATAMAGNWLVHAAAAAGVLLLVGALHIVGRRQSLRMRFAGSTACQSCGYDLTGTPSGVCPECGASFAARPTKSAA
jgi:predicted RNA-binding Zn-ribbon protein involved in translation (DUF1610 family)